MSRGEWDTSPRGQTSALYRRCLGRGKEERKGGIREGRREGRKGGEEGRRGGEEKGGKEGGEKRKGKREGGKREEKKIPYASTSMSDRTGLE